MKLRLVFFLFLIAKIQALPTNDSMIESTVQPTPSESNQTIAISESPTFETKAASWWDAISWSSLWWPF
jgi:hypothetical protein